MATPVATAGGTASFGRALGESAASTGTNGLITGFLGQLFGGMNARRQWRFQQKQMKLQQQYALEQMQKQSELSYANWQKQFDYENAYNDPTKVFDRYLKAGVTPAAVLGSSGVGVNATMSGGSASTPSASGPSGGSPVSPGVFAPGDPTAIAQNMMARSSVDRNTAAANRDNAEAELMRGNTHTADWRKEMDNLEKKSLEHQINNVSELIRLNRALADIHAADAEYADLMATYKFQDFVAMYSKHVGEAEQIKKYNEKYFDSVYAAQIARDFAAAYESAASGDVLSVESEVRNVNLADLREWFNLNWDSEIDVPEVDGKGKPTGKTIKMTGRQIHQKLMGLAASEGEQDLSGRWFQNRSSKNAFGYSMARTALVGAMAIAGTVATKRPTAVDYDESREIYDKDGTYAGTMRSSRRYVRRN